MFMERYRFPLPNYGNDYLLTQKELVKLLDNAYAMGFSAAKSVYDCSSHLTTATDNKEWKMAQEIGNR